MKDTSHQIEEKYRSMLLSKTGVERLQMASSMFFAAKKIALISLKKKYHNASEKELRGLLFLQIYGDDFSKKEREKIYLYFLTGKKLIE